MNISLEQSLSSVMLSAEQVLSATPNNPYDALKAQLFPSDYKFLTIDDIQVPEDITVQQIISCIEEQEKAYKEKLIETQINPDKYTIHETDNYLSIHAECSGENCFVVTEEKQKNYIENLELINSTDIDSVNKNNCHDIIKKLGYFYMTKVAAPTIKM